VRRAIAALLLGLSGSLRAPGAGAEVRTSRFVAVVDRGAVVSLADADGTVLVRPTDPAVAARVECVGTGHVVRVETGGVGTAFALPGGGSLVADHSVDEESGDLVVTQRAERCAPGVWGVTWSVGAIPREFAIVVPGRSGIRLDAETPGDRHVFDYPMGWEAQLVIVQGEGRGFHVFADDVAGRFKRLTVTRGRPGWRLDFTTINDAPFDALTSCESVTWRVNVHEGDWRVPARRYRHWMQGNLKPAPLAVKSPSWARDIRGCVITGMSLPLLDELARHFDPPQTLLYVPDWRSAGYDRDYPDYTTVRPELGPYLDRAHALGFRVMLHVNYFGVDPLNPLYREFERHHVRSAWGAHEPEWWTWDRADPPIKFAYINPASAAWRRHFVGAMAGLCRRFPVDALHLDQTLCIFNDHNGRIDGLNMIRGNAALHEDLAAALPEVALSGEGLNEITCRREAFAQRHVWGVHHSEGTWDEGMLRCAHPISSYLFSPFTTVYGYLGMVAPEQGQLYAAWNEAYEHFGVIPTLARPSAASLAAAREPGAPGAGAFLRQLLREVRFWQRARLDPNPDGPWPAEVAFPFCGAGWVRAVRTTDGRLVFNDRVVSRTVHGVNGIEAPGLHVPGWPGHGGGRILGLDPARRYALLPGVPDTNGFHVSDLPEGLVLESARAGASVAVVRTRGIRIRTADPVRLLSDAICGWRTRTGTPVESAGPLEAANGANFIAGGGGLMAHPPYRDGAAGGEAFARFRVTLPAAGRPRFASGVGLRAGAVGSNRSDGVTFRVTATARGRTLSNAVHVAGAVQLDLDLSPFAGRTVDMELAVHPGPRGNPSFDWALWTDPRVEAEAEIRGRVAVGGTQRWVCAIGPDGALPSLGRGAKDVGMTAPGTLFLLTTPPVEITLPLDLVRPPREVEVLVDGARPDCRIAGVHPTERVVGGVARPGLLAHPPNHGTTTVHVPLRLPAEPARFAAHAGIADGSKSDGVLFLVAANGVEVARRRMLPGAWVPVEADLARWAGRDVVLSLTTDSDGAYNFDWALWGEPRLVPLP
jgi:hypothetical protein